MGKSKIEWLKNANGTQGYSINPVKGLCPMACKDNQGKEYCYARRMYKRFKWNPEIRYIPEVWAEEIPDGSKVFIGSTFELFADNLPSSWIEFTLANVRLRPKVTYIFLTKKPENLIKWTFPENCWVGQSIEGGGFAIPTFITLDAALGDFYTFQAKVKFISFEPLLYRLTPFALFRLTEAMLLKQVNWLIIGCQTPMSAKTLPKREWVDEIIAAADKAKIPVFVKEPLASHYGISRQEFPS